MKNSLWLRLGSVLALVVGVAVNAAVPPPVLRTPNTTNISTGLPAVSGDVPTWNAPNNRWEYSLPPGAGGGEANTAISSGGSGYGVYWNKVGVQLQFNNIAGGLGITASSNANVITLTPTVQYQETNAYLTLLAANPNRFQATNANLTLWQAITPFNTNINYGSANGYVVSNQFVSLGAARAATLTLNDDAYAAGWDGSTNVPTKNAVYDKIQTITGATNIDYGSANTFSITNLFRSFGTANAASLTVNDDAYAAGWDASTNVPTKNAVYDKIQSLVLSGATNVNLFSANNMIVSNQLEVAGLLLISGAGTNSVDSLWATNYLFSSNVIAKAVKVDDDAYAAGWNGSTNVPTKNALYDKIEALSFSGATNIDYGSAFTYSVTNLFRSFGTANAATLTVNDDAYAAGWDASTNVPTKNAVYDKVQSLVPTNTIVGSFGVTADGAGSTLTTGVKGYVVVPYSGHITGWSIVAGGVSPTCTFDVWKVATGTALPVDANSIAAAALPALAAGNAVRSIAVSTWTTNFTAGDIIGFNCDAANAACVRATLTLETLR